MIWSFCLVASSYRSWTIAGLKYFYWKANLITSIGINWYQRFWSLTFPSNCTISVSRHYCFWSSIVFMPNSPMLRVPLLFGAFAYIYMSDCSVLTDILKQFRVLSIPVTGPIHWVPLFQQLLRQNTAHLFVLRNIGRLAYLSTLNTMILVKETNLGPCWYCFQVASCLIRFKKCFMSRWQLI